MARNEGATVDGPVTAPSFVPADSPGRPRRGRFIVFEGVDGVGKSTQAARLAARLGAVLTREPGSTALGVQLRALLLDPAVEIGDRAEALLMAADRAQHAATVLAPALAEGRDVVCDRYAGSSVASQGYGRGLRPEEGRSWSLWATEGLQPDLVVLLDGRSHRAAADDDRFEGAGGGFRDRVAEGFRAQAACEPARWVVVDAGGTVDGVAAAVADVVRTRLGDGGAR
jgi:dTMP kinase